MPSEFITGIQSNGTRRKAIAEVALITLPCARLITTLRDHDIDYFYSSRLPGEPADGVEDLHYHPLEPRTLRLKADYKF